MKVLQFVGNGEDNPQWSLWILRKMGKKLIRSSRRNWEEKKHQNMRKWMKFKGNTNWTREKRLNNLDTYTHIMPSNSKYQLTGLNKEKDDVKV